ncbi:ABC transporter ATP-binding protein [Infirmifilum lucidum]|uniref:ABC transporter ATP-binding protein n=1 Tax=Infirmifilum lucidum TaxID=2776706 RepID=A0A7L9FGT5_9CREN|nr:ABC transporter ATP-binding protein [Infirmifilum lucidum]QOJ78841.1 ABC transporter ATP-binding protein [Infirmifilum lucidum]
MAGGEWIMRLEGIRGGYLTGSFWEDFLETVSGVNLDIFENEILGIAGESGCGKTTLLRIMYGHVVKPLVLRSGRVLLRGENGVYDLASVDLEERRKLWWRVVGYIPQNSMNMLNPVERVRDHFLEILKHHAGMGEREATSVATRYVEEVGLSRDVLNAYPHQLSGGMRQRVVIALSLMLKPKLVLADEPTTGLDVVVQRGVLQTLTEKVRSYGSSLVIVSHDIGMHTMVTDRIAIMYAGKVVEVGKTVEVIREPLHPYTRALIESLPKIGDKRLRKGLPGMPPDFKNPPSGCRFHPRCPLAMDICKDKEPPLVSLGSGRLVACWLYGEGGVGVG